MQIALPTWVYDLKQQNANTSSSMPSRHSKDACDVQERTSIKEGGMFKDSSNKKPKSRKAYKNSQEEEKRSED